MIGREEICQVLWRHSMESFVGQVQYFEGDPFVDWEPVKFLEDRCDVG